MAGAQIPGPLGAEADGGWEHPAHRHTQASHELPGPVGTDSWHAASSRVALTPPRVVVEESVGAFKARAQVAIPRIALQVKAWNEGMGAPPYWAGTLKYGATAKDRNTIYTAMWPQLHPDRGRYWFQGATMVTGAGGIKSMEGTVASAGAEVGSVLRVGGPNGSDLKFVIAGNESLFPYNMNNFYNLRDGRGVFGFEQFRGAELDHALVVLEQSLVQTFIDSYPWASRLEKDSSLLRLSQGFQSAFANAWLKDTLNRKVGATFDFGDVDDRIRLGYAVVDRLRSRL